MKKLIALLMVAASAFGADVNITNIPQASEFFGSNYFLTVTGLLANGRTRLTSGNLVAAMVNNVIDITKPPFNANGSDMVDDNVAIQAALDYAASQVTAKRSPVVVYFPAGTYYIHEALLIKNSSIVIRGDGSDATVINMTVDNAHAFEGDDIEIWYNTFERFAVTKTKALYTAGMTAAFYFAKSDGNVLARRMKFSDVKISNWFYGIRLLHCVGLLCERIEAYQNNFAFYLEKVDSATFINCHAGDGYFYDSPLTVHTATNRFGFTNSVAYYYLPHSGGPWSGYYGFDLNVIGGETRAVDQAFRILCGVANIRGHHMEVMQKEGVLAGGTYYKGGDYSQLSWNVHSTNNWYAPITFTNGGGKLSQVGQCFFPTGPTNYLYTDSATDWINYSGNPAIAQVGSKRWYVGQNIQRVDGDNYAPTPSASTLGQVHLRQYSAAPTRMMVYGVDADGTNFTAKETINDNMLSISNTWTGAQLFWSTNKLVGFWKMNETEGFRNDSQDSLHLLPVGTLRYGAGKIGNAPISDSANDFLTHPDTPRIRYSGPFTVGGWVKQKTVGLADQPTIIIGKTNEFILYYPGPSFNRMRFEVGTNRAIWAASGPVADTWIFWAAWYDGTNAYIQRDNGTIYSTNVPAPPAVTTDPLEVCRTRSAITDGISVDELFFFKRVLSTAELTALYNAGTGVTYTNDVPSIVVDAHTYNHGNVQARNLITTSWKWVDILTSGFALASNPAGDPPVLTEVPGQNYTGWGYYQDGPDGDRSWFTVQSMHKFANTNATYPSLYFEPHVHLMTTNFATGTNATFRMDLYYGPVWGYLTNYFVKTNTMSFTNTYQHGILSFGKVTNDTLAGRSSVIFHGQIMRLNGGDGDIGAYPVWVESLDIHAPIQEVGTLGLYGD